MSSGQHLRYWVFLPLHYHYYHFPVIDSLINPLKSVLSFGFKNKTVTLLLPSSVPDSPEPMQLGGTLLTPAERQHNFRANLCVYCVGQGHRVRECPVKELKTDLCVFCFHEPSPWAKSSPGYNTHTTLFPPQPQGLPPSRQSMVINLPSFPQKKGEAHINMVGCSLF